MQYYASKTHDRLNGQPFDIENITEYICLNPKYKAHVKPQTKVLLDSGAFQDVSDNGRLSFEDALSRQLNYEKSMNFQASFIVSYDRLVDEQVNETGQFKKRVDTNTGEVYVKETIASARFLVSKREELYPRRLILSCQGTTTEQYMTCLRSICEFATSEDIIGFGGFCIISRSKEYEEQFYTIVKQAFPYLHLRGIKRVHIFGVGVLKVLIHTELLAKRYEIDLSYDTSSMEINAVMGRIFDPMNLSLSKIFEKTDKLIDYHPAKLAKFNINMINQFWKEFKEVSQ